MSAAQQQEPGILPKLVQMGLAGATGSIVTQHLAAPFLDGSVPASGGVDITNSTPHLAGAELHSGPAEGGTMLDRPAAGYLADHSTSHGLNLEYAPDSVSEIASSIDQAGTMTVNGETIKVLDYAPGGEFIQAAGGAQLDAADALGMMGHAAVSSGGLGRELTRNADGVVIDAQGNAVDPSIVTGGDYNYGPSLNSVSGGAHRSLDMFADDNESDDSAEAQIDKADSPIRQQLELDHRLAMQAALQTSDETEIETTVHAGDKSLSIKTSFEARLADNSVEQKEGEEHLQDVMRRPGNDIQSAHDHFRMRSIIEANDTGLGLTL